MEKESKKAAKMKKGEQQAKKRKKSDWVWKMVVRWEMDILVT
jgi:hypothetical protein